MSLKEQAEQIKDLKKVNNYVAAKLNNAKKLKTLLEFLQLQSEQLKQTDAFEPRSLLGFIEQQLEASEDRFAEKFWEFIDDRCKGVDNAGDKLMGSDEMSQSAVKWLHSWAHTNGIDDPRGLEIYGEWGPCSIEFINIVRALFRAIEVTSRFERIVKGVITGTEKVLEMREEKEKEDQDESIEAQLSDGEQEANIAGNDNDAATIEPKSGNRKVKPKSETECAYDEAVAMLARVHYSLFVEIRACQLLKLDPSTVMKDVRAQARKNAQKKTNSRVTAASVAEADIGSDIDCDQNGGVEHKAENGAVAADEEDDDNESGPSSDLKRKKVDDEVQN